MIYYTETLNGFRRSLKEKKVFWRIPAGRFTETVKPSRRIPQSDIFCVESVNDNAKYGTKNKIWQKTAWLYAQLMKIQLIFLARQFFLGSSRLVNWLVKGTKQKLVGGFSFDTLNLGNKVVKQKHKWENGIKCSFIYHAELNPMHAAS